MNDCFWCFINNVCTCSTCNECKDYLSVNSDKGMELYEKYQSDVDEYLKPLSDKWKKIKENLNND